MLYDGNTREARLVKNLCLDVENTTSVVVKQPLIVLKWSENSPFVAYKYTSFKDPANTLKTRLPNLPNNNHIKSFSVCKLADNTKVILSGGKR